MKKIILLVCFLVLCSCNVQRYRNPDAKALNKFKEINRSAYQTTYDASRRGSVVYINYDNDSIKLLAEPPADAIVTVLAEFTANINVKDKINAETASSYLESVTKLSATSVSNTLLRDALYRLNEMQFNGWKLDENYEKAFTGILKMVSKVADLELQKSQNQELLNEKEVLQLKNSNIDIFQVKKIENEGFEAILEKDIDKAIEKFTKVEELYPTYHNAYELKLFLTKVKANNRGDFKEIKKEILESYSWGMSPELKKLFEE